MLDTLTFFERRGWRPETVYKALFKALVRLSPSMYAEEFVTCVRCLARNLQRVGVLVALAVEAAWMLPLFCCIDNYR